MNKSIIILFDLDHTLYEAYWSWRNPLSDIFGNQLAYKKFPWDTYFKIREHSKIFDIYFKNNFRHYWLTPELAGLLILLIENKIKSNEFVSDLLEIDLKATLLKKYCCRPGLYYLEIEKEIQKHKTFLSAIHKIKTLSRQKRIININNEYYSSVNLHPHTGVEKGLQFLQDNDIKFYLASEGDYSQQLFKINKLSLDGYFKNKILASEIYKLNKNYIKYHNKIDTAIIDGSYLRKISKKDIMFADEQMQRYELIRKKEEYYYYYSILNAIDINPTNPEKILLENKYDQLLQKYRAHKNKLFMIGDRVDKDILPLWRMFGEKIILLRVRTGKYKKFEISAKLPKSNYTECSNTGIAFEVLCDKLRRLRQIGKK
jgi:FMN phosphatase YigB (HAD superfamily)